MAFPEQCDCRSPGYCAALQRNMTAGMFRECQQNLEFRKRAMSLPMAKPQSRTTKPKPQPPVRIELECVYRSRMPVEWGGCGCHVYDCELHERCVPWRKPTLRPGVQVCAECSDRKTESAVTLDHVTIAITYWNRPEALKRLQASINRYLPNIPVIVEDTGGNLSAGRNRLYAKVQTPYLIMMEEDFVVLPSTPKGIANALAILNHDATIAGVGGIAWEPKRGAVRWGHDWKRNGNVVNPTPSKRPLRTLNKIRYRPCDLILNWGVFRAEIFQRVPWDESFPVMEHQEQYWRMNQTGYQFAFYSGLRVNHLRDRPTKAYKQSRYRSFAHLVKRKHGFTFGREV